MGNSVVTGISSGSGGVIVLTCHAVVKLLILLFVLQFPFNEKQIVCDDISSQF